MPDLYAFIAQADVEMQTKLADVLELRAGSTTAGDAQRLSLSELQLPSAAIALEVGCGTGAVSRILAEMPGVREVVGIARMCPLTSLYSTPRCAMFQTRSRPFVKPIECFVLAAG